MIDDVDIEKLKAAFKDAAGNADANLLWEGEDVIMRVFFNDISPPPVGGDDGDDGVYDDGIDDGDDRGDDGEL
jgi:hypothetical protein